MKRIYRPALGYEDEIRVNVPSCTVLEREPTTRYSGLLDASSNRLMVVEEPNPIGFVIFGRSQQ